MTFPFITGRTDRVRDASRQVMWHHPRLHSAVRHAARLVREAAAIIVAAPSCFICGKSKAEVLWVIDPIGGIYGACVHCAESNEVRAPRR